MRHLIFTLALIGCGRIPEKPAAPDARMSELRAKDAGWLAEIAAANMPSLSDCDLALWAGEARAAGATVDISGFESAGAIRRNPKQPCTPASRDDVLGYTYGSWVAGDLTALQRVADYGEIHGWAMSDDVGLSWIDWVGRSVLAHAIDNLSHGTDKRAYESTPILCAEMPKDYIRHLVAVEATFAAAVTEITAECAGILATVAKDYPQDALFVAASGLYSGDQSVAIGMLLDDTYQCPSYVRGDPIYCAVHKAFAASIILKRFQ